MNRKQIVMDMRTGGFLKGHRPAVVFLKKNIGKIYLEGTADFVLSMTEKRLHFQRLSFFTKKCLPKKDFSILKSEIKSYQHRKVNIAVECLTLYTQDRRFIEIYYYVGIVDTIETEENMKSILQNLIQNGVKESHIL